MVHVFMTLTLCWAVTQQSKRSRVHSPLVPSGFEALATDPLSTTPRAADDIDDADTVDGEAATGRTVPVPKLGLQPRLAPGPSSR